MISYKYYKKWYKNKNIFDYILYVIRYFYKSFIHTIYSCYLCLRFPFLYPRNRFSGKHYTNWKILDRRKEIYCKWNDYSKSNMRKYWNKFGWDAFFYKGFNKTSEDIFEDNFVLSEYVMKLADKKDRFLYWFYGFYHQILEIIHFIPSYNELDTLKGEAKGWYERFGIRFCKDLREALIKDNGFWYMIKYFRIEQIKEKMGNFECYVNYYTPRVTSVIKLYGKISKYYCIDCGDYATKRTIGWIESYCDNCYEKGHNGEKFKYINPKTNEEINHNDFVDEELNKI